MRPVTSYYDLGSACLTSGGMETVLAGDAADYGRPEFINVQS
jgi:hypothetical protein